MTEETLKTFVRERLGCTCPDEVFEQVETIRHPDEFAGTPVETLCVFGGKLLLAVADPDDWHSMPKLLQRMMQSGRNLRESRRLNRFRLVIATDNDAAAVTLQHIYNTMQGLDDRMHLHFVSPDSLPDSLRKNAVV